MAKTKKPRNKAYRPRPVDRFPTILLNAEPFEDRITDIENDLQAGFIQLFMGAGGRDAYVRVMNHFLLGELLAERFHEEKEMRRHFEGTLAMLADAFYFLEESGEPNTKLLTAAEGTVPLLMETIRKAPMKSLIIDLAFLKKRGNIAIQDLFSARIKDVERKAA